MSSQDVVLSLENGVRTIRLNRPKIKNAFNREVYAGVTNTLNNDANNDNVVVTIITGTGDYYSSGFDIKYAMSRFADGEPNEGNVEVRKLVNAFINYPKLIIALVNGPAIGIAATTTALCDIVYATDRASFETPFLRIGLCAEAASSYTFPRILGRSKASEMLYLGKKMTAEEAYQFGFVSKVIPHSKLNEFTQELKQLGKLSINNIKVNKKLVMDHYKKTLTEASETELAQLSECVQSQEFSDGIMNFMSRKSKL